MLEAQNDTMSDIDSKAMRTVRFDVLLIGLLITAARFAGTETFDGGLVFVSIGALAVSTLLGILTYSESNLYVGPDGSYLEQLARDDVGDDGWEFALIDTIAGMLSENADALDWNSWVLTVTQTCLAVGIVAAVLATAI